MYKPSDERLNGGINIPVLAIMNPSSLVVEGNLTIYDAIAQKQALLAALNEGEGLELDLSRVGEIDTAGLQLLILLKREAQRLKRPLRLVGHSQAVAEAIQFFNIAGFLGDPLVLPGSRAKSHAEGAQGAAPAA